MLENSYIPDTLSCLLPEQCKGLKSHEGDYIDPKQSLCQTIDSWTSVEKPSRFSGEIIVDEDTPGSCKEKTTGGTYLKVSCPKYMVIIATAKQYRDTCNFSYMTISLWKRVAGKKNEC
jgi:hypothetical protein